MKEIQDFLNQYPVVSQVLKLVICALLALVVSAVLLRLMRKFFQRISSRKKMNQTNTRLIENAFRFLIIFIAILWVVMSSDLTRPLGQTIFQGTAVLAAIAGFAAQNVLADLLCGLMISSTKPFVIGDRVELESGFAGIVKDITLRHVVLQGIDTQVMVVPNSKMNAQMVRNLSYHSEVRSVDFHFQVAYGTDTDAAREIVREAIMASPLSVPGKQTADGKVYADVYFLAFRESSLELGTTGYYAPTTPTEVFKTDVNTRVKKALEEAGIEIPYNYLNVKLQEEKRNEHL